MPGETATQHHSFGYSSPSRSYPGPSHAYEVEMGISPEAFGPVFQFRKRHGEINWRKVAMIDVDKVARELDIDMLQEHIQTVAFCNIDAVADLDPMFAKLFKLAQYMIEYMLHSQSSLQAIIGELEGKLDVAAAQQHSAEEKIKELDSDVQKLKAENKKRRKMIEQQQMLIESGASSYYKCPHCEKAFMNASFLQGHMQRKHPGSVNYIGDVIAHSQREQSRLAGKLEILDADLQRERDNFTEKLKKAEEEKAAWGARTRRDMQRWKKEEEGKWRKELETMKKSFLDEIQQLKSQETEYKKKINSLQQTMDERHSNLGDLVDDIEGEKQKLNVYEQRIKTLEKMNSDKDNKLKTLTDEMLTLKEQNRRALSRHAQQMADTYDPQLRLLMDQVGKQPKKPREKEIVRPTTPEPADSEEEREEVFDGKIVDRKQQQLQIMRQIRPSLSLLVDSELQKAGVDPKAPGISTATLTNKMMVRKTERQRKARQQPGANLFAIRDRMRRIMDEEARKRGGSPPRKKRGRTPTHLPRQRQFSPSPVAAGTTKDRRSAPASQSRPTVSAEALEYAPLPKHRNTQGVPTQVKQDKPMTREELNTRFEEEDDDESPWDSEPSEQQDIPGPSKQEPKPSPSTGRQETPKTPITARIPTSTPKQEDSWNSDDLEDLLSPETDVRDTRLKNQGDAVKETRIKQLAGNIESIMGSRNVQKPPPGAVDLFRGKQQQQIETKVQNEESEDEDDDITPISSISLHSPTPAPRVARKTAPQVKQSLTGSSTNTSVWGSNQKKQLPGDKDVADQESDWDDISDY